MKEMLVQLGKRAKDAEAALRTISTDKKNQVLAAVADHLVKNSEALLKANEEDVKTERQIICRKAGGQTPSYQRKN